MVVGSVEVETVVVGGTTAGIRGACVVVTSRRACAPRTCGDIETSSDANSARLAGFPSWLAAVTMPITAASATQARRAEWVRGRRGRRRGTGVSNRSVALPSVLRPSRSSNQTTPAQLHRPTSRVNGNQAERGAAARCRRSRTAETKAPSVGSATSSRSRPCSSASRKRANNTRATFSDE